MEISGIVGHDQNIERLMFALNNDYLPSAYLFVGADGIGKTTMLRVFAQLVNCRDRNICHHCDNCKAFDSDNHPDFLLIRPSGKDIRIGQIQGLISRLNIKPTYAQKRIVLVKQAHRLNQESANSFLKILEEPPLDTLIVLMTSDENLLLETLVSRCQKMMFSPLNRTQIETVIAQVYQIEGSEKEFVLNYSGGRIRKEFIEQVSTLINLRDQTLHLLQNLESDKMGDHFNLLDKCVKQNLFPFFLEFCSSIVRDLLCLFRNEESILTNKDIVNQLTNSGLDLTEQQLQWIFNVIVETELCIQSNASKSLALESFLVQVKQILQGVTVI